MDEEICNGITIAIACLTQDIVFWVGTPDVDIL